MCRVLVEISLIEVHHVLLVHSINESVYFIVLVEEDLGGAFLNKAIEEHVSGFDIGGVLVFEV